MKLGWLSSTLFCFGETIEPAVSHISDAVVPITVCTWYDVDNIGREFQIISLGHVNLFAVVCKDYLVISWIRSHKKCLYHASVHSSEGPRKAWRASSDSHKSKCSHANHEAHSPTVTAKNIEHLWVMADRRRRRRLGIHSTSASSADHNTQYRPDDSVGSSEAYRSHISIRYSTYARPITQWIYDWAAFQFQQGLSWH